MRAVRLTAPGGPERLVSERIATPTPGPGEALVRVEAAAITRDELEWPLDRLPAIPSYELCGVVAAIADDVADVSVGERVYALTGFDRDGVAADYATVPASRLAPKPEATDAVESASIALAGLSAWQGLFDHGGLEAGERVLIHGAAGGVGQFATQLARRRDAQVIGTASEGSVERARALGADQVVDYAADSFTDVVEPVDLVFDTAGGERLERSPTVLRRGGRLVSIVEEPPATGPELQVRSVYFTVEPSRAQLIEVARLVDGGELRPAIDSVFALDDFRAAFERAMEPGTRGKVVLRISED